MARAFYVEQSDAAGNVFSHTANPLAPYQVFEGVVGQGEREQSLRTFAPEWMRVQQHEGFGWAKQVLTASSVWEVDGTVRELTRREYMQLVRDKRPSRTEWVGVMRKLFEEGV
jgi:hypothetical protein